MKNLFTTLIFSIITSYAYAQIDIIHPPNWWVGFETQNLQLLVKGNNISEYEVGIKYFGRKYSEGKKITWIDGFRAIYCIIYYSFFD